MSEYPDLKYPTGPLQYIYDLLTDSDKAVYEATKKKVIEGIKDAGIIKFQQTLLMGNDKITIFYDRSKEFDVESMSYHIKHHISFRNKEFGYAAWWAFSYRYGLTNLCEILELVVKRKIKAKKNIRDRRGKYRKD